MANYKHTYVKLMEWDKNDLAERCLRLANKIGDLEEEIKHYKEVITSYEGRIESLSNDNRQLIDDVHHLESEADGNRCLMQNLTEHLQCKDKEVMSTNEYANTLRLALAWAEDQYTKATGDIVPPKPTGWGE